MSTSPEKLAIERRWSEKAEVKVAGRPAEEVSRVAREQLR